MPEDDKRRYIRLTESQWAQLEAEYSIGDATLEDLANRHGVSVRAIQYRLKDRGIEKGSAAPLLAPAVPRRDHPGEINAVDDLMEKARQVRQDAYDAADTIERLVLGQLQAAQTDPSAVAKMSGVFKALSLAAGTIERTSEIKRRSLGISDDSAFGQVLPTLVLDDITQKEIEAIQRGDDDNDDEILELPGDFALA